MKIKVLTLLKYAVEETSFVFLKGPVYLIVPWTWQPDGGRARALTGQERSHHPKSSFGQWGEFLC